MEGRLESEVLRVGDEAARPVVTSAIERIYGKETADEASADETGMGPASFLHDVMHKLADPGFVLSVGAQTENGRQTSKTTVEAMFDECVIRYLADGISTVSRLIDAFVSTAMADLYVPDGPEPGPAELLEELSRPMSRPVYNDVARGILSVLRRKHGDPLVETVGWNPDDVSDEISEYVLNKLPRMAESALSSDVEARLKRFFLLVMSRLGKLPDSDLGF